MGSGVNIIVAFSAASGNDIGSLHTILILTPTTFISGKKFFILLMYLSICAFAFLFLNPVLLEIGFNSKTSTRLPFGIIRSTYKYRTFLNIIQY